MSGKAKAKLVTFLHVNFIGLCQDIAEELGIDDYHDVWDILSNDEGFPNDSYQVISREINQYWEEENKERWLPIVNALNKLYPEGEELIAWVSW